ncbi:putative prophage protein [Escherichia coli]|nr:putative prophage protein [Escherichia coli]
MTSITREQAKKIIEAADEVISALAGTNEDVHPGSDNMLRLWDDLNDHYAPPEVVRELARIVLASLEAEPVAWRYRYVKKGVTDSQGEPWVGDWKYVPTKEDCNDRPSYEIQALFTAPPVPVTSEGLVKAVRFYEQVKRENPPVETGAWKDAIDWVLKEACQVVNTGIKGD